MNSIKLKKIIDQHQYISFDVFDTLILRKVSKTIDVFYYMCQQGIGIERGTIPDSFPIERKEAEMRARNKKGGEVRLTDIYGELKGYSQNEKKQLIEAEKKTELLMCIPNKKILEIFNYCKKKIKK